MERAPQKICTHRDTFSIFRIRSALFLSFSSYSEKNVARSYSGKFLFVSRPRSVISREVSLTAAKTRGSDTYCTRRHDRPVRVCVCVCECAREVYRYEGWFNQCPRLSGTIISARSLRHTRSLARASPCQYQRRVRWYACFVTHTRYIMTWCGRTSRASANREYPGHDAPSLHAFVLRSRLARSATAPLSFRSVGGVKDGKCNAAALYSRFFPVTFS